MSADREAEVDICPRSFNCHSPNVSLDIGTVPSYVSLASSILACAGSLLLVGMYVVFKDLRKSVAQNIISQLALADLANAVGIIVGAVNFLLHFNSEDNDGSKTCQAFQTICVLQSYVTQWAGVTSYILTSLLAVFLMLRYTCTDRATVRFAKVIPLLTVISWTFPLLFLLPMLALGKLGYSRYGASNWCYIKDNDYGNSLNNKRDIIILMIFADWLWQLSSIFVVLVSFAAINVHICYQRKQQLSEVHENSENLNVERRLLLIPIIYVIIHIWDSCQLVSSFILSDKVDPEGCTQFYVKTVFFVFGILQGIGDAAQGWVNAILYIFASSKLRKRLFFFCTFELKTPKNKPSNVTVQHSGVDEKEACADKGSAKYSFETKSVTLVSTGIGAASDP